MLAMNQALFERHGSEVVDIATGHWIALARKMLPFVQVPSSACLALSSREHQDLCQII